MQSFQVNVEKINVRLRLWSLDSRGCLQFCLSRSLIQKTSVFQNYKEHIFSSVLNILAFRHRKVMEYSLISLSISKILISWFHWEKSFTLRWENSKIIPGYKILFTLWITVGRKSRKSKLQRWFEWASNWQWTPKWLHSPFLQDKHQMAVTLQLYKAQEPLKDRRQESE